MKTNGNGKNGNGAHGHGANTGSPVKKIYIPYMCDHGFVLAAALEAHHLCTEVLPPPDDESLAIGLEVCRGKECSPCFTTTGDIVRRSRRPDFDPARSALLMPGAAGMCRFGQYAYYQRDVLESFGLGDLEILSPTANNSYQGFGDHPTQLRRLVWQGVVAVDMLEKLLHEYRPYELNPGQTDQIYREGLDLVVDAIRGGGGKKLTAAMKQVAVRFEALPVNRRERRPLVGMVGEIYLRFNAYSNQDIIRKVEAAGGEVVVASMMEWFYYTNLHFKERTWAMGQYGSFLITLLVDKYQQVEERRFVKPVEHLLRHPHESPVKEVIEHLYPHYEPAMGMETEAGLSLGKAVDFARKGVCGILNIMPFSCMPGIIVAGMAPRFRADLDNIPWLDISYDAQGGTNLNTRLEAFMYQAVQFQRRTARLATAAS